MLLDPATAVDFITRQGVFGANPYLYCGNNPLSRRDPTGLEYGAWDFATDEQVERDSQFFSNNPGLVYGVWGAGFGGALAAGTGLAGGALVKASQEYWKRLICSRFTQLGAKFGASVAAGGVVIGAFGTATIAEIQAALTGGVPVIHVVTRLTASPLPGRALSVAYGAGAQALTAAARAGGQLFSAAIPRAVIVIFERIGLAKISTTMMNGQSATEIRFMPEAMNFLASLFRAGGP